MDDWAIKLAKRVDDDLFAAMCGPIRQRKNTALRVRGNSFETVELDECGNVIEPPPRCCYGLFMHEPNCKFWGSCT